MTAKRLSTSQKQQPSGPFVCETCDRSFSRIENLTRHAQNHKPTTKFVCLVCEKRFTRSDLLKRHVRTHGNTEGGRATGEVRRSDVSNYSRAQDSALRQVCTPERASLASSHALDSDYEYPENLQIVRGLTGTYDQDQGNSSEILRGTLATNSMTIPTPGSPSPGRSWTGVYCGVYGEGSFDADLAWILDMDLTGQTTGGHTQGLVHDSVNHPSISAPSPPQQSTTEQYSLIENENAWPEDNTHHGDADSVGILSNVVSGSYSWVQNQEMVQFYQCIDNSWRHRLKIGPEMRARLLQTLTDNSAISNGVLRTEESQFPDPDVLEYFIMLFFEYVHPRFPIIHRATFTTTDSSPFLLLAMMFLGSSYCRSNGRKFVSVYLRQVISMFLRLQPWDTSFLRSVDNLMTLLFLCISGVWCGQKDAFELAEGARGILATAARRCKLFDCRPRPLFSEAHQPCSLREKLRITWNNWVDQEKRKRLGLSICMFDLQFPALFQNQPYISKVETINLVLPCDSIFWEAKSAEAWKVILGPSEMPPSIYFMVALDTCLFYPAIRKDPPYAPLSGFSKTLLMYSLFTHIFEWKQSLNIVVYSGFIRGPENTGPGEGLKERQGWLQDALDAWLNIYHKSNRERSGAPAAALLLHYLAGIYIDINISHLHLFAGQTGLREDIQLAEESLRRWCESSHSSKTLQRVREMLNLAYQTIENGSAHECSFEIAVALLTGGLTCWMYGKLGGDAVSELELQRASKALETIPGLGISTNFAQILKRFNK